MLVSTECGGEGRNFEFCTRLVLFDLPWSPVTIEQRIGRLDRIGRDIPVEIVYFVDGDGFESQVVDVYERIGLFREPLGSIEPELLEVESALRDAAVTQAGQDGRAVLDRAIERTREASVRVREAAWRELHRDPFASGMADAILQRVPDELEELTEEVILGVADQLRLKTEQLRGEARWSIEFGTGALVDSLPGVPSGSAYSGSFSREEAVADEMGDFFASGHPMVEALLAHEDESASGRVGLVESQGEPKGFGLVALYREGDQLVAHAVDLHGKRHPEWEELTLERPMRSRRVQKELWVKQKGWPDAVRRMAAHLPEERKPLALLALRVL
jgi:ATP-dependent helicase HepA